MPTRRQLLSLGVGAAGLLAIRALLARADEITTRVYVPLVQQPEPTPTATAEPSPTPTLTPTSVPSDPGWIIAPASGTADQAVSWITARCSADYTRYDVTTIVQDYQSLGNSLGVDWFLALAQCAHETGSLTSWWSQRPRRNPAGIGVTGKVKEGTPDTPPGTDWAWDGTQWREGVSFASWADESIPAHLGRLLAYALPAGTGTPAQQSTIAYALSRRTLPAGYRGVAPTIIELNGRWAYPGTTYGQSILNLAQRMRAG